MQQTQDFPTINQIKQLVELIFDSKIASLEYSYAVAFEAREYDLASQIQEAISFLEMKSKHHTQEVVEEGQHLASLIATRAQISPSRNIFCNPAVPYTSYIQAQNILNQYAQVYECSLWWHDLGRALERDNMGRPTGLRHAEQCYFLAQKNMPDSPEAIMTRLIILNHSYGSYRQMIDTLTGTLPKEKLSQADQQAIEEYASLSTDQKQACLVLSCLVRDADKLGNWRAFGKAGINRNIAANIPDSLYKNKVYSSPYEMDQVLEYKSINYSQYKNFTGVQLAHMCWASDFALHLSKEIAIINKYMLKMIGYMIDVAEDDTCRYLSEAAPANSLIDVSKGGIHQVYLEYHRKFLKQVEIVFKTFRKYGWISPETTFDLSAFWTRLLVRLEDKDYAKPRVLTNGIQRYAE